MIPRQFKKMSGAVIVLGIILAISAFAMSIQKDDLVTFEEKEKMQRRIYRPRPDQHIEAPKLAEDRVTTLVPLEQKVTRVEANDGVVVEIITKDGYNYSYNEPGEIGARQQIVQVRYKDGTVKELLNLDPKNFSSRIHFSGLSKGKNYYYVGVYYWEGASSHIFDIATGEDILKDTDININWGKDGLNSYSSWAHDDSFFAFLTYFSEMGETGGEDAVYVVFRDNPHRFVKIFEYGNYSPVNKDIGNVGGILVHGPENIIFFAENTIDHSRYEYNYNVRTGVLERFDNNTF